MRLALSVTSTAGPQGGGGVITVVRYSSRMFTPRWGGVTHGRARGCPAGGKRTAPRGARQRRDWTRQRRDRWWRESGRAPRGRPRSLQLNSMLQAGRGAAPGATCWRACRRRISSCSSRMRSATSRPVGASEAKKAAGGAGGITASSGACSRPPGAICRAWRERRGGCASEGRSHAAPRWGGSRVLANVECPRISTGRRGFGRFFPKRDPQVDAP